jgi:hypothetical protein
MILTEEENLSVTLNEADNSSIMKEKRKYLPCKAFKLIIVSYFNNGFNI